MGLLNHKEYQKNLRVIKEIISKQSIVQSLVHNQQMPQKDLLENLLHRQQAVELQSRLAHLHNADMAHLLEALPVEERLYIWQVLPAEKSAQILMELSDPVLSMLLDSLNDQQISAILAHLDADDLAYTGDWFPRHLLEKQLQNMTDADRDWIKDAQGYDASMTGYLMTKECLLIEQDKNVDEVIAYIRGEEKLPAQTDKIFVTDKRGHLNGILPLDRLLLHQGNTIIRDIMIENFISFSPYDDSSQAAKAFERYNLVSAPVINERGRVLGRITVDVIMDYLRDSNTDDVLNMAGFKTDEDLFAPVLFSVKNRGLWLIINLLAAFLISRVIGLFETTLSEMVSLAILMPVVAAVGGNIGNQTASLIIRAITLEQINNENQFHLARKEILVNSINGCLLGLIVALFSYLFYQNISLSMVIGAAMFINLIAASIIGFMVPILLQKFNYDPAMGSSIITTAAADSMGFVIFLGLASIFLI